MRLFYAATKRRTAIALFAAALALVVLSACGRAPRKTSAHVPAPPRPARVGTTETGIASWYGVPYHGRQTASGEIYDMQRLTAAHRTLPFQTWLDVTNLSNGKHTEVRVTDRGPFIDGRVIDLSLAAAREIDMVRSGTARVRLRVIAPPKSVPPNNVPPDNVASRHTDLAPELPPDPAPPPESSTPTAPAAESSDLLNGNTSPPDPKPSSQSEPPSQSSVQPLVGPSVQPPVQPPVQRGYVVQAGAFADRNRAEALLDALARQLEVAPPLRVLATPGPHTLWRVLAGRNLGLNDATAMAVQVRKIAGAALILPELDLEQGAKDTSVRGIP